MLENMEEEFEDFVLLDSGILDSAISDTPQPPPQNEWLIMYQTCVEVWTELVDLFLQPQNSWVNNRSLV